MVWEVRVQNHPPAVTADLLIPEVFVDHIFTDAVKAGDRAVLADCFELAELGLGSSDEVLREIVDQHVGWAALSSDGRARATQELAGPLLRTSLDRRVGTSWRQQVGGFGPDEPEPEAVVMMAGYLFRGEFLWHSGRYLADRSGIATTEPFARMPSEAGAYEMGVALAKALSSYSTGYDDELRHEPERFLAFAGGIDWTTFYRESLEIALEGGPDSYEALLYTIHKSSYGTSHISHSPEEPVLVPDWRDAAAFGTSILAAFGRATTD
ncbi:hypothetical protein E1263_05645 [Kribbella antibiotica]|uniref:Uncharacterized protein n=1 Tax=Kribbella antibiotica TaxID=190195 RepID=A0A4R4ZTT8_9ACTN|nr:hypothetical protein [Kribbella antibiotica]TDD61870.1 hypothetical protein E1263_05645 [Kribbella antibiotica]